MIKDKFTMELTWHNCLTHPPKEDYNICLLLSNGVDIFYAEYYGKKYFEKDTWVYKGSEEFISNVLLDEYYWADIRQTVEKTNEFKKNEQINI